MGMFFLGAWIPWKFRQLCRPRDFTEGNYRRFREKAEIATSLTMRDGSPAVRRYGPPRNRVGVTQRCELPCELTFSQVKRTPQNSLYAAAIYGPSLRALNLVAAYRAMAKDGASLSITLASEDPDTLTIVKAMDASLAAADGYRYLASFESPVFTQAEIDSLGDHGLSPTRYRASEFDRLKPCFQRKLLPGDPRDPGYPRTRTARLLLATLRQRDGLATAAIRDAWYTGMFEDGTPLRPFPDDDQRDQCAHWAYFMARQYQRYAIELFLWCFETALVDSCHSIDDVVDHWAARSQTAGAALRGTFRDVLQSVAEGMEGPDDMGTSQAWNRQVYPGHERFENVVEPQDDGACVHGLRMFAGWFWRMLTREQDEAYRHLMALGASERIGMGWFMDWLRRRQELPIRSLLSDVFSDLVFSQHMRVALARFDGRAQRLRFILGDNGIEPTRSARADLGKLNLPHMPDRLDTLAGLLCDIDVLTMDGMGRLRLGPRADSVAAR